MADIADTLTDIRQDIKKTALKSGRKAEDIKLVAVSKRQPVEKIIEALEAGQRCFGENRVQDAQKIWPDLAARYPDKTLHLIGPLQSNKAAEAVKLFDVIETIDRPKIARALAAEMAAQNKDLPCFIQVNTGEEAQKSGVLPQDLGSLYQLAKAELGLNIVGLMCIPPIDEAPGLHFALLRKLAGQFDLPCLSMGMSSDYQTAIKFSATHIRVGTGLFGARDS
ncbi:MAG: YggS family pyridoxal phosphate-dependent enzyme [Pseudomonadota bacterium]